MEQISSVGMQPVTVTMSALSRWSYVAGMTRFTVARGWVTSITAPVFVTSTSRTDCTLWRSKVTKVVSLSRTRATSSKERGGKLAQSASARTSSVGSRSRMLDSSATFGEMIMTEYTSDINQKPAWSCRSGTIHTTVYHFLLETRGYRSACHTERIARCGRGRTWPWCTSPAADAP